MKNIFAGMRDMVAEYPAHALQVLLGRSFKLGLGDGQRRAVTEVRRAIRAGCTPSELIAAIDRYHEAHEAWLGASPGVAPPAFTLAPSARRNHRAHYDRNRDIE